MRNVHRLALTATAVAGLAAVVPATAGATPSVRVTAVTISDTVVGNTDYVVKEITIAPGGSTGWHWHSGPVYGVVKQGTLTHNMADCSIDGIYHPGQRIAEPSGSNHVHVGRNLSTTPVVLAVTYADPVGSPLAVDAPNPNCSFE
jgi:quercetin dioxygenase-like cupin family protein